MNKYENLDRACNSIRKQFNELDMTSQVVFSYTNLVNTVKYAISLIDENNVEDIFKKHCSLMLDSRSTMDNIEIDLIIHSYWMFIQANKETVNPEAFTWERVLNSSVAKTAIGRGINQLYLLIESNYGFYPDLTGLDFRTLSVESLEAVLKRMEDGLNDRTTEES